MIRLIALDLDGTTMDPKNRLNEETKQALFEAMEQGVWVVPTTGRMLTGIPKEIMALPNIRYVLTSNGAVVNDVATNQVIYQRSMTFDVAEKVLRTLQKYDGSIDLYYGGNSYNTEESINRLGDFGVIPERVQYMRETRILVPDLLDHLNDWGKPIEKYNMIFGEEEQRQMAWKELEQWPEIQLTTSLGNNLEVNCAGANKGDGLAHLCSHLGLDASQVMAVGDGGNDMEMIRFAGLGVAMENALPEVKECADYITKSNAENGVAHAIQRFVLNVKK